MSTPSALPPAVEVSHLRKVYGSGRTEVVAIRDATMSIARGEIVGMLGPSGSGKSTILTAMALINPPTSGRISINGSPVLDGPRALVLPARFPQAAPRLRVSKSQSHSVPHRARKRPDRPRSQ